MEDLQICFFVFLTLDFDTGAFSLHYEIYLKIVQNVPDLNNYQLYQPIRDTHFIKREKLVGKDMWKWNMGVMVNGHMLFRICKSSCSSSFWLTWSSLLFFLAFSLQTTISCSSFNSSFNLDDWWLSLKLFSSEALISYCPFLSLFL